MSTPGPAPPTASTSTAVPTSPLTAAEAALIPSRSLPIASQLAHLLDEFTQLSLTLFAALSSASVVPIAPTYASLAELDRKLAAVLALAAEHQARQARINDLVAQLDQLDRAWISGATSLHSAIASLQPIVETGALERKAIANSHPDNKVLTPATILSYARLLAPFTSAPPTSLFPPEERMGAGVMDPSGRGLPVGAIPPFPTEAVMRRGRLQFGKDDLGMGETGEVGVRKDKEEAQKQPARQDAGHQLQQHAKFHEAPQEEFFLDLDLNPDL